MKRMIAATTVVALLTAVASVSAAAQAFPVRPVRLIVPFPPGGATDTFSRVAAAVIDTLKRYETAGVTDLCVRFAGNDQIPQLEQFIREVVPAFASAA